MSVWLPPPQPSKCYRRATTSAASTCGFLVLALRIVRMRDALAKPAALNSSRKAPPSLAPAIQANHVASPP